MVAAKLLEQGVVKSATSPFVLAAIKVSEQCEKQAPSPLNPLQTNEATWSTIASRPPPSPTYILTSLPSS